MLGLTPSSLAEHPHSQKTVVITTVGAEPSGDVGQEQNSCREFQALSKGFVPSCPPASLGWTLEGWQSKTAFGWETKSLQPMESSLKT